METQKVSQIAHAPPFGPEKLTLIPECKTYSLNSALFPRHLFDHVLRNKTY